MEPGGFLCMKKYFAIAILLGILCPSSIYASTIKSFYGVTATIPDGWEFQQGEQVIIYSSSSDDENSGAVIVDRAPNDAGSADTVVKNLADAVCVKRDEISRDESGALSINFVQEGEPVCVRVLDVNSSVLMVYTYGANPIGREISMSIKPQK